MITPLTLSTFVRILNKTITENVTRKPESPYYPSITRLSHYRLCFDAMNLFLMFVDKEITLTNKIQGIAMCGHDFMTEEMHKIAIHRHGIGTLRKKMPLFAGILKVRLVFGNSLYKKVNKKPFDCNFSRNCGKIKPLLKSSTNLQPNSWAPTIHLNWRNSKQLPIYSMIW